MGYSNLWIFVVLWIVRCNYFHMTYKSLGRDLCKASTKCLKGKRLETTMNEFFFNLSAKYIKWGMAAYRTKYLVTRNVTKISNEARIILLLTK